MSQNLEDVCIQKGLKMTEQRKVIARVISSSTDHPSVEEVYNRASQIDEKISLATVYRTMNLFEQHNIIEKLDFRDGRSRYEESDKNHHHHLIDITNDRVIEFEDEELEILKKKIAKKLGYQLVDHRLELYGVPLKK